VEWFRRKTWTDQDRSEFFARLDRSRNANRAQYARIQAVELIAEPTKSNIEGALELLTLVLESYPDQSQIAPAHHALGNCHELIGHAEQAMSSYRNALEQQRLYPGVKTAVHIDFALLVAESQRRTDYDEALDVLNEFGAMDVFPVSEFKSCAARVP